MRLSALFEVSPGRVPSSPADWIVNWGELALRQRQPHCKRRVFCESQKLIDWALVGPKSCEWTNAYVDYSKMFRFVLFWFSFACSLRDAFDHSQAHRCHLCLNPLGLSTQTIVNCSLFHRHFSFPFPDYFLFLQYCILRLASFILHLDRIGQTQNHSICRPFLIWGSLRSFTAAGPTSLLY